MSDKIACDLHDYIETACIYRYQIKLLLKDGSELMGVAVNTLTSTDKREYLLLENSTTPRVELTAIKKMTVLTANAKIKQVIF